MTLLGTLFLAYTASAVNALVCPLPVILSPPNVMLLSLHDRTIGTVPPVRPSVNQDKLQLAEQCFVIVSDLVSRWWVRFYILDPSIFFFFLAEQPKKQLFQCS